ncbi:hypothetical protein [Roseicyclus persicicus]|uniref:Succinate dehydrogenase n=1 Tax=Roseicyclus persicicus TaxID=2650661 RepID=A0A7X6GZQ4_9RHOB|nr:hypothetical protein [Roseibacterium persicicum]NKX44092.1 hypothetical protein [Roseibacterium persicicum]
MRAAALSLVVVPLLTACVAAPEPPAPAPVDPVREAARANASAEIAPRNPEWGVDITTLCALEAATPDEIATLAAPAATGRAALVTALLERDAAIRCINQNVTMTGVF